MLTKKCSKCDEIKELVYFPPKGAICRQCHCQRAKEWYKVNKEKKKEYDAQYRKHNLEKLSKYGKRYYEDNKETIALKSQKYRENNKVKKREMDRTYRENNSEKIAQYKKEWYEVNKKHKKEYDEGYRRRGYVKKRMSLRHKKKMSDDPLYRVRRNLQTRLSEFCSGRTKKPSTMKCLGCTLLELKTHLESQFQEGMLWENYGEWHIDHIIPASLAENKEELIKLFHYTNLQPLWAAENMSKGNKVLDEDLKEKLLG